MIVLSATDICKSYGTDVILENISFHVNGGDRIGIVGANGAGKTTLLDILSGRSRADSGNYFISGDLSVGYLKQNDSFEEDRTLMEEVHEIYGGYERQEQELASLSGAIADLAAAGKTDTDEYQGLMRRYGDLQDRFDRDGGYSWKSEMRGILHSMAFGENYYDKPIRSLSGGERTRLALACLLMRKPDLLMLDEPTNHLDMQSIEWLEDYIDHYKGTVLTVSHDRYFLDRIVKRIVELDHGGVEFYSGNYSFYVKEKEARYKLQLKQYEKEQAKISQLEKAAEKMSAWAYSGMDKTYKRVFAIQKRIEWLRQTEKPTREERLELGFSTVPFRADYALRIKDLKKSYGERTLFENVTETIRGGGERVALVGANGAGKTTLLKILLGEESPDAGVVQFGPSVRAAYLPQQITFEHPERTLYDTLLYDLGCEPQQARNRLGAYRFRGEDQFKLVSQLSGGERARLKLCMLMNSAVNMLILDEPTNHLDLDSREWIESAVDQFEGTLLIVSHDRYFVNRFANRIWELDNGRLRSFDCGYEKYRFIREREDEAAQQEQARQREAEKAERAEKAEKKPARRDGKIERRMNVLERDIAKLEQQLDALDAQMEENASDYVRLGELEEQKNALQAQMDALYEEWEQLDSSLG